MISDEERMKVVKALREPSNPLDIHASLYNALGTCAEVVATTVPADYYEHNNRRLLNRLADLIEPAPERTCHPVIEDETAVCSECGEDIDGYGWTYCPNCGAKVGR